jgi:hypothetical protein
MLETALSAHLFVTCSHSDPCSVMQMHHQAPPTQGICMTKLAALACMTVDSMHLSAIGAACVRAAVACTVRHLSHLSFKYSRQVQSGVLQR